MKALIKGGGFLYAALLLGAPVSGADIRGSVALEQRFFPESALSPRQTDRQTSLYAEPEFYAESGDLAFLARPFLRWDSEDDERRYIDAHELLVRFTRPNWELNAGVGEVFWGQMESINPVDIINQRDYRETVDGKTKLGQPMVNLNLWRDWGTTSVYLLPYFRERPFSGPEGRLRPAWPVNQDRALYEDPDEERALDWAARWSRSLGRWDLGLSWFDGTDREPLLLPRPNENRLQPYYRQLRQVGLDALYIRGAWIWKLEAAHRDRRDEDFVKAVAGFERTLYGVLDSQKDLGLLLEYQRDTRSGESEPLNQNDLFLGARLVFNDMAGTEILVAVTQDLDRDSSHYTYLKSSGRLNARWTWELRGWWFDADEPADPLYGYRRDDFIQASLQFHF